MSDKTDKSRAEVGKAWHEVKAAFRHAWGVFRCWIALKIFPEVFQSNEYWQERCEKVADTGDYRLQALNEMWDDDRERLEAELDEIKPFAYVMFCARDKLRNGDDWQSFIRQILNNPPEESAIAELQAWSDNPDNRAKMRRATANRPESEADQGA